MTIVTTGFSTCPNDTFIFHAMLFGLIDTEGLEFSACLHDVEELNRKAFRREYDVSKLSFCAYLKLRQHYEIFDAGSALGFGCGPLLVSRSGKIPSAEAKIAIPGNLTTAYLLLRLWRPELTNVEAVRFDRIMDGVADGTYDAGLIIHEGRFVYPDYGCQKIVDLGEWWEAETHCPIPLGCIAVAKDSQIYAERHRIDRILKNSIDYAFENPTVSRGYIKENAQELDDTVIDGHIRLYVNNFTRSLGETGRKAITTLEEMALKRGIL